MKILEKKLSHLFSHFITPLLFFDSMLENYYFEVSFRFDGIKILT